jgi:hypothetical protein
MIYSLCAMPGGAKGDYLCENYLADWLRYVWHVGVHFISDRSPRLSGIALAHPLRSIYLI